MINIRLEGNLQGELQNIEYEKLINQLMEENTKLQNEIQILHKQKCDFANQLNVLTDENRILQNEKRDLSNQLIVIKKITERY